MFVHAKCLNSEVAFRHTTSLSIRAPQPPDTPISLLSDDCCRIETLRGHYTKRRDSSSLSATWTHHSKYVKDATSKDCTRKLALDKSRVNTRSVLYVILINIIAWLTSFSGIHIMEKSDKICEFSVCRHHVYSNLATYISSN